MVEERPPGEGNPNASNLVHDNVLILLELNKDPKFESKVFSKNAENRMVPRILRYALELTANHPMPGRVTVPAIAGTLIRFWFIDGQTFATTRVWYFARPEHVGEIVKMVGFLLGPREDVLQVWRPPLGGFSTRVLGKRFGRLDPMKDEPRLEDDLIAVKSGHQFVAGSSGEMPHNESSPSQPMSGKERDTIRHWEWVGEGYKELWWRKDLLFGRRTTIWEGKVRRLPLPRPMDHGPLAIQRDASTIERPILDCFVKATFLPPGLEEHEHEMITCLDPAIPLPEDSEFAKLDDEIKSEVYRNLPRSLGLMELKGSNPIPGFSSTNAAVNRRSPNLSHSTLVALVIEGPIGKTLEPFAGGMTLADVCEIYQGVFAQLWYGAEKGVHFRDVSPGNILWRPLADGRKTGFLIDYGNARFENERRDKSIAANSLAGLCEDDLRSGTRRFLCVAVLNAAVAVPVYLSVEAKLHDQTMESTRRTKWQRKLERLQQTLLTNRHRYIDDLESALYNLLSHASRCVNVPATAADIVNSMLANPEKKRKEWETELEDMAKAISDGPFCSMITACVEVIQDAREALQSIMLMPDMTGRLTALERLAFRDFWDTFIKGCRNLRSRERAGTSANVSPA